MYVVCWPPPPYILLNVSTLKHIHLSEGERAPKCNIKGRFFLLRAAAVHWVYVLKLFCHISIPPPLACFVSKKMQYGYYFFPPCSVQGPKGVGNRKAKQKCNKDKFQYKTMGQQIANLFVAMPLWAHGAKLLDGF